MPGPQTPDPREAFEQLYRATRTDLLRYLLRRCGDAEEAADLLAETYMTAWRRLDAIPAGERARLWLFGVARNLLLRSVRRQRVADVLVERLAAELRRVQAPAGPSGPHGRDAVTRALAALPEQDREILMLTAWEGLAPREIARVMGTSANVVRIRLHRARARVKKDLGLSEDALPRSALGASE
jgi:RNA polymerase sigma-70 factor (ECF subfamily)